MGAFLNDEQEALAGEIAERLIARGDTIAVAEATTGGLVSAALLAVVGASRFYAGGAVLYTLGSRTALGGVPSEEYADYQGTTPEMLATLGESVRQRLDATWCIAETGLAGPTGGRSGDPPGRTTISVCGPMTRTEVFETGIANREANMVEFTTLTLRYLSSAIAEAGA